MSEVFSTFCKDGDEYIIAKGDTLGAIAGSMHTTVQAILAANPGLVPEKLYVGQRICVPHAGTAPGGCNGTIYTIQSGDTLWAIANRYGTSVDAILRANTGLNAANLMVGQKICIGTSGGVTPPPVDPGCAGTKYVVVRGDTFYLIATKNKITVDALQKANPTVKPENLVIGQVLCVPSVVAPPPICTGVKYTVKKGDTLYSIAQWNKVSLKDLLAANPSVNPEALYVGQIICIPKIDTPAPEPVCSGTRYQVVRGDTFFAISKKHGISVADLMSANPNVNPEKLYIGQTICIPTGNPHPGTSCSGNMYVIKKGDTFYDIARVHGLAVQDLLSVNTGVNPEKLYVGQTICIPNKVPNESSSWYSESTGSSTEQNTVPLNITDMLGTPELAKAPVETAPAAPTQIADASPAPVVPAPAPAAPAPAEVASELAAAPAPAPAPEEPASESPLSPVRLVAQAPSETTKEKAATLPEHTIAAEIAQSPIVEQQSIEDVKQYTQPAAELAQPIPVEVKELANEGIGQAGSSFEALEPVTPADAPPKEDAKPSTPAPAPTPVIPAPPSSCSGTRYTIVKGDTFWGIAQRYGITNAALVRANPQANPDKIYVGQILCIPGVYPEPAPCNGVRYTVQKGDTLYQIAVWNDISLAELLAANPGVNPETLAVGQVICVPKSSCNGKYYIVVSGDTLFSISRQTGVAINDIADANPGVDWSKLGVGTKLCIPVSNVTPPFCLNGAPYLIKKGDTLYQIALRFGVNLATLLETNPTVNPMDLKEGTFICLPDPSYVPPKPLPPVCKNGTVYTVVYGDTIYSISERTGISYADIAASNPGVNLFALVAGDFICLPTAQPEPVCSGGNVYYIQKGDTLWKIAQANGLEVAELLAANPGVNPEKLEVGQIICVPKANTCKGARYPVQKGDTFYKIALAFSLTVDQLIAANPGVDYNKLEVGQLICLPKPGTTPEPCTPFCYVVCCGDTVAHIASEFGITIGELKAANPWLYMNPIRRGMTLAIPCPGVQYCPSAPDPQPIAPPSAACSGTNYVIQKGDSFYLIAQRYGIALADLMASNPGVAPEKLVVGQVICIPSTAH
ncbi:MAG: LysM peptidoglycan-binding domain-containing protein [Oscillospiraceae bacterium]|jgi:LysM repeat protein|nr:LysM peptidoglycan-binding domain-containing protein [Oscillospiraceae bacterium]